MGRLCLLPINKRNKTGCMVNEIIRAERIPIIDTTDMECSAGCLANTSTPTPKMVVITDNRIDALWVGNARSPVRYSCSRPLVIKML